MENLIILAVAVLVIGLTVFYIIREKKKGRKCVGCPSGGCSGCSGCK